MSAGTTKERLLRELWDRDERYYDLAREQVRAAAKLDGEYEFLRRWLPVRGTVLEIGCGEGSNLAVVERPGLRFVGCDLSALGLARARAASRQASSTEKPGPGIGEACGIGDAGGADNASAASNTSRSSDASRASHATNDDHTTLPEFLRADAERLPFPDRHFEGAFAVSLLEHLPDPGTVIEEMIRVLAPGGRLVLISPQYGGPLGASPCRRGGGAGRFLRRLARAHWPGPGAAGAVDRRRADASSAAAGASSPAAGASAAVADASPAVAAASRRSRARAFLPRAPLGWDRVEPLVLQGAVYDGDLDAVIEPELTSLKRFLGARGVTIEAATSGFEWHTWRGRRASLPQRAARALLEPLGRAGIAPYRDFGPLLAVAGYKEFRA